MIIQAFMLSALIPGQKIFFLKSLPDYRKRHCDIEDPIAFSINQFCFLKIYNLAKAAMCRPVSLSRYIRVLDSPEILWNLSQERHCFKWNDTPTYFCSAISYDYPYESAFSTYRLLLYLISLENSCLHQNGML